MLDPTLSLDSAVRRQEGRYLSQLAFETLHLVAGVPVLRSPARAWAAAPLLADRCELATPDGSAGTVPMHPLVENRRLLQRWIADITRHAEAWGPASEVSPADAG